jgi:hypothetical protein
MDFRNIENGSIIPCENYCDQPYTVVLPSGNWLCVMTTGPGLESKTGQHVVATISEDRGATWSELIDIEPSCDKMTSWATSLLVPGGRVYAIYCYDFDGKSSSVGGWLVYRYTDDGGRTWSRSRYRIPIRETKRDRTNDVGGKTQFFWSIDKPIVVDSMAYLAFSKLANRLQSGGEGWVLRSDNIVSESDPEKIRWELLPAGEEGILRPVFGDIQEEFNIESISDGSLYMVYRTEQGIIAKTTSTDSGETWSTPQVLRDVTDRPIRNPRACPRIWKAPNGKFLLWHHNNGYPGWGDSPTRQPVWISGGIEDGGDIRWSQPEILIYMRDQTIRGMSYPDFIYDNGDYFVTETQKLEARVHAIDTSILNRVWNQHAASDRTDEGLLLNATGSFGPGARIEIPPIPDLDPGSSTIELRVRFDSLEPNQDIFNSFGPKRRGVRICTNGDRGFSFEIADGQARRWTDIVDSPVLGSGARVVPHMVWDSDPNILKTRDLHHIVFILDGAARIILIVVDGMLCDGGDRRIQGWWRTNPEMHRIYHEPVSTVSPNFSGSIETVRIYERALTVSESIGNCRSG